MTIFGFNTDIRHGNTVFHVQTEARESELTMQSAIFVRGRCVGKYTVSYADQAKAPDFGEQYIHELVTRQHRMVVTAIREGRLTTFLNQEAENGGDLSPAAGPGESAPAPSTAPKQIAKLSVGWLPDGLTWHAGHARMRFRVTLGADGVAGARVITRLDGSGREPRYAEAISDSRGEAELVYNMDDGSAVPGGICTVLVKATAGAHSATRKFRLQRD